MTTKTILVDLDGTLADTRHRNHMIAGQEKPDWLAYSLACSDDRPVKGVVALLDHITIGYHVIVWSGRHDAARRQTERWLSLAHVRYDQLYMRSEGDTRPNVEYKIDLFNQIKKQGFEPVLAIDDYPKVLEALTARRVPGLLVARNGVQRRARD